MRNTRQEEWTTLMIPNGHELSVVKEGVTPLLTELRVQLTTTPAAEGTQGDERS